MVQVQWVEAEAPLRGLEAAVARLEAADGVRRVVVGRQASVKGHVSQELELWLGREHEGGKFDLVARSANLVQVRTKQKLAGFGGGRLLSVELHAVLPAIC